VTAWQGIQIVRELDATYIDPLNETFPATHLGPHGDDPQVESKTCHHGVSKPLLGASMAKDYPELSGAALRHSVHRHMFPIVAPWITASRGTNAP
jgi:photosynthetic reaction center cytochrome c subunit